MIKPFESALVVIIPEAESLVETFRRQVDPSAAADPPAHVTILYPFKPPDEITADVMADLRELFLHLDGFSAILAETRQFPDTLYLAPQPAEPFRQLIEAAAKHFPETPPYGKAFTEIVPHLTVALVKDTQRLDEIAAEFREVARDKLPIHTRVNAVSLIDNSSGHWQVRAQFSLGPD